MTKIMNKRKVVRLVVEAVTPLAVGSGEGNVMTDSVVAVDFRGLPYIPGTSLAGVLRHAVEHVPGMDGLFGKHDGTESIGSKIIVSEARIVDFDGTIVDGVLKAPSRELMNFYADCPVRQHVCINEKGVTDGAGKFDNQVVYKGTRFCFDLECLFNEDEDEGMFDAVLGVVLGDGLRVGGGVRKGYGRLEVRAINSQVFDLGEEKGMKQYLDYSSKLVAQDIKPVDAVEKDDEKKYKSYLLKLSPEDFVFFGSGLGNKNADSMALTERYVHWSSNNEGTPKDGVVFPGSSIKGAFAHRFRYWYNVLDPSDKEKSAKGDTASRILFGTVDGKQQVPGLMFFEDVILDDQYGRKVFNHVMIDRFTGGAFPGALYNEEALYMKGVPFELKFTLDLDGLNQRCASEGIVSKNVEDAIDLVVRDIKEGLLPLGGLTNRGHGCFKSVNLEGYDNIC